MHVESGVADAGTECDAAMAALSGRLPWLTALVLPQRHLEIPQRKRLSHSEPPRREQQCLLLNAVCGCSERILCSHGCSEPASTNTRTHTVTHGELRIIIIIISAPEQVCFVKEGSWARKKFVYFLKWLWFWHTEAWIGMACCGSLLFVCLFSVFWGVAD